MRRLRTATLCLATLAAGAAGASAASWGALPVEPLRTSSAAAVMGDGVMGDGRFDGSAAAMGASTALDDPTYGLASVARDRAEARCMVEREGAGTYFQDLLAATDSSLTRWPVRTAEPLTYWIQPGAGHDRWTPGHRQQVDAAFAVWGASGIPIGFLPAADSASADILVLWTDRFEERISGKTRWTHDRDGWIRSARITLALHRFDGDPLTEDAIHALALHEIGHAIGLDHTPATENVMAPRVRVRTLSDGDRRTARLLYRIPPGHL